MKIKVLCVVTLVTLFLAVVPANGEPYTYTFANITSNNAVDAAIGEAQLSVDVSSAAYDLGSGTPTSGVLFTFHNEGSEASSICDVYFLDGTLLDLAKIIETPPWNGTSGVDFEEDANPPGLPGGGSEWNQSRIFASAQSPDPTQPKGVNPGESLGVFFTLLAGNDLGSVLTALADGTLKIGVHVQGFDSGGSESFVHTPVPAAVLLGMIGLTAAGVKLRRFA